MNYLIGLNEKQINFLLDVLDHTMLADEGNEPSIKLLGNIRERERLVLGRYGRVLRADPSNSGRRTTDK